VLCTYPHDHDQKDDVDAEDSDGRGLVDPVVGVRGHPGAVLHVHHGRTTNSALAQWKFYQYVHRKLRRRMQVNSARCQRGYTIQTLRQTFLSWKKAQNHRSGARGLTIKLCTRTLQKHLGGWLRCSISLCERRVKFNLFKWLVCCWFISFHCRALCPPRPTSGFVMLWIF
jgi:hypothetical protein